MGKASLLDLHFNAKQRHPVGEKQSEKKTWLNHSSA
jgi:hypothetical protein